jgi:Domain of unknown function (DUF1707)/Cell wall-active antibiotics response 4TMS YvqF
MDEGPRSQPAMLASDDERERVALVLRDAAAEGRLTLEELSERVASTYSARTSTELEELTRDLPAPRPTPSVPDRRKGTRWVVAVMSGAKRKGRWRPGERSVVLSVMGGAKLDLRDAEITGSQIEITAISIMGGIRIVVPEGIEVDVSGVSIMGGKKVKVADVPPRPGTPVIRVRVASIMGGVEVQSRPPRRPELRSGA